MWAGGKQVQQRPYQVAVLSRVPKRPLQVDGIAITPARPGTGQVTAILEVAHDRLHGALGDPDDRGEVPHPRLRVLGDRHQRPAVRGQQGPAALTRLLGHDRKYTREITNLK